MVPRPARFFICAVFAALAAAPGGAAAGTYQFAGVVTGVDDPYGALLAPASVGATVSGFFRYDGSARYGVGHLDSHVTAYTNERSTFPQLTDLGLTIGGAPLSAASYSLTNLQVGDNEAPGSPFWPAGDSFRYVDTLAYGPGLGSLVDLDGLEDQGFSPDQSAAVLLSDPTGTIFSSQALPVALPLAALVNDSGAFYGFDDNTGDTLYTVSFRIDAIQSVPEPGSAVLVATGAMGMGLAAWATGRRRRIAGG